MRSEDVAADQVVFKALADVTRRRLLDRLRANNGQTLSELCTDLGIRRQSVTQHLDLLIGANLVSVHRHGRERLHYLNPVPIREIQKRWIAAFDEHRLTALDMIKQRAEESAMTASTTPASTTPTSTTTAGSIPDYSYTTYIRATPEQVWDAITDPDVTARFWGHSQVSTWEVGAKVEHVRTDGSGIADAAGTVVEVDRPHRLSFGFDDPQAAHDPTHQQSVVTFAIERYGDIVKLTVTQTRLPSLEDLHACSQGWPSVIANLKTLLETGDVLPQEPWAFHAQERAAQMEKNG